MAIPTAKKPGLDELKLMAWLSPAFPVGAFAYSHGLEWAVEAGDIVDAPSLIGWLENLADFGAPRADAVLFASAYKAAWERDWRRLEDLNELAVALANGRERRLETTEQGGAFVNAARAAWDCEALAKLDREGERVAYPVAVAACVAGHGVALEAALPAFALSLFANLISAAVRLSAIGQTDGQRALAKLLPRIAALARLAAGADLAVDETPLGGCALRSDLAALRHETQYSRLFRS
jgi:urease accessory protein